MTMGDENDPEIPFPLLHIGDVGHDQIDPELIVFRKLRTDIEQDQIVLVLHHGRVLTDFAYTAEGKHPQASTRSPWARSLCRLLRPLSLVLARAVRVGRRSNPTSNRFGRNAVLTCRTP